MSVIQPVQYGIELQAVARYLSQYQIVPFKRLQELFDESGMRVNKQHEKPHSRILRDGRSELAIIATPKVIERGRVKQHHAKNLHDRLVLKKHESLTFVYDLSVPFD